MRHDKADPWTAISLTFSGLLGANDHAFLLMFMHNSTQPALLDEVQVTMSSGQRIHAPSLDMNGDGLLEWGDPDVRIGSWGFEDHFSTGERTHRSHLDSLVLLKHRLGFLRPILSTLPSPFQVKMET